MPGPQQKTGGQAVDVVVDVVEVVEAEKRTVDNGLKQIMFSQTTEFRTLLLDRFVQVDNHDDAGLDRRAEQRDEAHPNGH